MEQHRPMTFLVLVVLLQLTSSALIFYPELPVDQTTLYKAQVALDRWERCLDNTYATPNENPYKIKRKTDLVVGQLRQVGKQLHAYNNVVLGAQNGLLGSKNLIIGNKNAVYGNNNFIFSEGFSYTDAKNGDSQTAINNFLVNDNWVAQLNKRAQIKQKLHEIIYSYK